MGPRMFQYAFCAVMASAAVMVTTPVTAQVIIPTPTVIPGPATPAGAPDWLTTYGLCGYAFPGGATQCEVPVLPGATAICDPATCPPDGTPPPGGDITCGAGFYRGGATSPAMDCRFNAAPATLDLTYAVGVDIPYRILLEPFETTGVCSDVDGQLQGTTATNLNFNVSGLSANNYRVGVYMFDSDSNGRAQDVRACVLNADDSVAGCSAYTSMSTFNIGEWANFLVEVAAGQKVRIEHVKTAGANPVSSGVFFDVVGADPCVGSDVACTAGVDLKTHGDWPVAIAPAPYGTYGQIIFNRNSPTAIGESDCVAPEARSRINGFGTDSVSLDADPGVCAYRYAGPLEGCTNLNNAMSWVFAPNRLGTEEPPVCDPVANPELGLIVRAECQPLFNDCVAAATPPVAVPSWDDAGERTGQVGDGPDLKIAFHVPPGSWQVCFYMVDYDDQGRAQVLELAGWANQPVSAFTGGTTVCYPGLMGGDYTLRVRSTAGPNALISSMGWRRLDLQGQPIEDPALCAGLGECEPCSYTQGGWGQTAKGSNVGDLRDAHFSEVYPAGVTVGQATCTGGAAGSGNVMTFASSLAVENFLPCGGTPDMLSMDYSNPTCGTGGGGTAAALRKLLGKSALSTNEIKNVFAAQVLALKLNVDFSDHLTTAPDVPLGNLLITEGPFAGMTVRAFLAEAEEALSCGDLNYMVGGEQKSVMTIGAFNEAASNINESRDECEVQTEFTACPVGVAAR